VSFTPNPPTLPTRGTVDSGLVSFLGVLPDPPFVQLVEALRVSAVRAL
jgi:hypothetical protein